MMRCLKCVSSLLAIFIIFLIEAEGMSDKSPLQTAITLPKVRPHSKLADDPDPDQSRGIKIGNLVDIRWKGPPLPPIRGLSFPKRKWRRRPRPVHVHRPPAVPGPGFPVNNIVTGLLSNTVSSVTEIIELVIGSIGLFLYVIYSIITVPLQIFTNSAWDKRALLS